jgi:hypothetical protein
MQLVADAGGTTVDGDDAEMNLIGEGDDDLLA